MAGQGTVFDGLDPTVFMPENPLMLFCLQALIVLIMCKIIHIPLALLRQPSVIAEVIAGIILGPSVMGHIPDFSATVFPDDSLPPLRLVANIGLMLFLFIVGMEVDVDIVRRNIRSALAVSVAGMVIPFGLGCALAYGLYNQFVDPSQSYGIFTLFVGVAISITALPVLARILTELQMLRHTIGTIALSAAVGDDVAGWTLLALTIALVNSGGGLTLLYVILCAVAWALLLLLVGRPLYRRLVLYVDGSFDGGPSVTMISGTILMVLTSSFFTDVIGVHPIFGAFLVGIAMPRDDGYAIELTKKIEDIVSVLFLPLYFALSGLNTNIGLLNSGIIWGYIVAIIVVAISGKILGCAAATRLCGNSWSVAFTVGCLMSCKGLVELVVLNLGMQAGIINQDLFSMFVVMAVVATFATTPLVMLVYPPSRRGRGEPRREPETEHPECFSVVGEPPEDPKKALTVVLRYDDLAGVLTVLHFLGSAPAGGPPRCFIHGVHIVRSSDRFSTLLMASGDNAPYDPLLVVLQVFAHTNNLSLSAESVIVNDEQAVDLLANQRLGVASEFVLLPWTVPSGPGGASEASAHLLMVRRVLETNRAKVALLVDRGLTGGSELVEEPLVRTASQSVSYKSFRKRSRVSAGHKVTVVYTGSRDDGFGVELLLKMAGADALEATVVDISGDNEKEEVEEKEKEKEREKDKIKQNGKSEKDGAQQGKAAAQLVALVSSLEVEAAPETLAKVRYEQRACRSLEELLGVLDELHVDQEGDLVIVGRESRFSATSAHLQDHTVFCVGDFGSHILAKKPSVSVMSVSVPKSVPVLPWE